LLSLVNASLCLCPVVPWIAFMMERTLCAHTQSFLTSLVSRSSHHSFLMLSFPIDSLHCAQALLYYRLMTVFPPLHTPHFFSRIARVVDAPRVYLQNIIPPSHPFHPFVEPRRSFVPPVACIPLNLHLSFVHLPSFSSAFFIFHLRLHFFFCRCTAPPAYPSSLFFSLYGQTNLKNHQTKHILSLYLNNQLFFLFILFQIDIDDETSCSPRDPTTPTNELFGLMPVRNQHFVRFMPHYARFFPPSTLLPPS